MHKGPVGPAFSEGTDGQQDEEAGEEAKPAALPAEMSQYAQMEAEFQEAYRRRCQHRKGADLVQFFVRIGCAYVHIADYGAHGCCRRADHPLSGGGGMEKAYGCRRADCKMRFSSHKKSTHVCHFSGSPI